MNIIMFSNSRKFAFNMTSEYVKTLNVNTVLSPQHNIITWWHLLLLLQL